MGLKVLHSADWHLDSPFSGFTPEQREYLKQAQRKLPGRIADLCRREKCDLVLLSGDIFDGVPGPAAVQAVRHALADCRVPVLIAPGNHDYLSPESPWKMEAWPENVHIFRENLDSVCYPGLDCRVYGAGYRSMDCPGLLENFRARGEETYQLAVLHGDPLRVSSPYCPVTAAQVRDSGLSYLALGHIHKSGAFRVGDTLCAWPGCPMGRGYDETLEKGVYILELGEKASLRFFLLDTPRFYDLEVSIPEQTPADVLPGAHSMDFYRLTLTGSGGEPVETLRSRFAHIPNLELLDRREQPADPWEHAREDTLEGTYFRLLREKLAEAPEDEAETIRLAARISRQILEGREVAL